jgi:hypothetical protein
LDDQNFRLFRWGGRWLLGIEGLHVRRIGINDLLEHAGRELEVEEAVQQICIFTIGDVDS